MNQINVAVSGFALLTMLIVLAYITLEKGWPILHLKRVRGREYPFISD